MAFTFAFNFSEQHSKCDEHMCVEWVHSTHCTHITLRWDSNHLYVYIAWTALLSLISWSNQLYLCITHIWIAFVMSYFWFFSFSVNTINIECVDFKLDFGHNTFSEHKNQIIFLKRIFVPTKTMSQIKLPYFLFKSRPLSDLTRNAFNRSSSLMSS